MQHAGIIIHQQVNLCRYNHNRLYFMHLQFKPFKNKWKHEAMQNSSFILFFFYCWQCWAVLESKGGNIRRARELFDAATVADAKHIAAWHGWAILEIKQGNIKKARNLLGKALKYCGGNEYIYQTLALLEAKAERFEQAQTLFQQATQSNPKSCASWLVSIWFIIIFFFCEKVESCLLYQTVDSCTITF